MCSEAPLGIILHVNSQHTKLYLKTQCRSFKKIAKSAQTSCPKYQQSCSMPFWG